MPERGPGPSAPIDWGAPPPADDLDRRGRYFSDWQPRLLPRRGGVRPDGRRAYEIRVWMRGWVYLIDDDLSFVADVDLRALLARLEALTATLSPDQLEEAGDLSWLRWALKELIRRSGAIPPGTAVPPEDWHLQDLEVLRRVAARVAAGWLPPERPNRPDAC